MEVAKQGDKRPLIGAAVIFGTSWRGICEIVGVIIRPSGLGIHPMSTISLWRTSPSKDFHWAACSSPFLNEWDLTFVTKYSTLAVRILQGVDSLPPKVYDFCEARFLSTESNWQRKGYLLLPFLAWLNIEMNKIIQSYSWWIPVLNSVLFPSSFLGNIS